MSRAQDERRRQYARYKKDVQERGKPFHPYAMFHDTVMSFVVVSVIVGLAVVWKFSAGEDPEDPGVLGVLYAEEADPGTTSFVPRPDWYFYFLFYLLRIFKWPDSVILGTIGIPTIALLILIALPFLDRRPERRLLRRPVAIVAIVVTAVSMGVLTYKGATVRESLGSDIDVPGWLEENNLPQTVLPGAELVANLGCLQCHTYLGDGSSNFGAPELSEIGAQEGKDAAYFQRYVSNPSEFGNNIMQPYASQGEERLRQIAQFLAASKGG